MKLFKSKKRKFLSIEEEYLQKINTLIEQDTLNIDARFHTHNILGLLEQCNSTKMKKNYRDCLNKLFNYARKKNYIDTGATYEEFCNIKDWSI